MELPEQETRAPEGSAPPTSPEALVPALEAMLFVSPEPVTVRQLQAALPGITRDTVQAALALLASSLGDAARGLQIQEVGGGYRLATKADHDATIRALTAQKRKHRLSPAARETLAIVAYKQPITAPEITEIRGVDCASAIKGLLERRLLRILGRKEVVGRPILYGTTKDFLSHFGLKGLEDLPTLEEFDEITMGLVAPEVATSDPVVEAGEVKELMMAEEARELRDRAEGEVGEEE